MSFNPPFDWKTAKSPKFGDIFLPVAYIEMKSKSGEWKIFYPEIDTGAVISVFSLNDCERLGYDLIAGDPFDLKGGMGGCYPSYIHKLEVKIGGRLFTSRIAFTAKRHNRQYLGLMDIFDKFDVYFIKNQRTHFS